LLDDEDEEEIRLVDVDVTDDEILVHLIQPLLHVEVDDDGLPQIVVVNIETEHLEYLLYVIQLHADII